MIGNSFNTMKRLLLASLLTFVSTLAALFSPASAQELQSVPFSYLSTASTNCTTVWATIPALLTDIIVTNTTMTTYYLKMYNKNSTPAPATDTPSLRAAVPPQSNGNGVLIWSGKMKFPLGVGFCLTGAIADTDTTNAATGILLNFGVVGQ